MIDEARAKIALEAYRIAIDAGHAPEPAMAAVERLLRLVETRPLLAAEPSRLALRVEPVIADALKVDAKAAAPIVERPAPPRQKKGPLSEDERAIARDMRAAGATNAQIAARLDRRLKGFHLLLRALDRPAKPVEAEPAVSPASKLSAAIEAIREERRDKRREDPRPGVWAPPGALPQAPAPAPRQDADAELVAQHLAEKGVTRLKAGYAYGSVGGQFLDLRR